MNFNCLQMVKFSLIFPHEQIHMDNFSLTLCSTLAPHGTDCCAHELPATHPVVGEMEQWVRCDPCMEELRWVLNWNYSAQTQLKNSPC